ncbi:MAG: hypothetical protein MJ252_26840 [archaeon]|nr:hypothetical protein [archaeon]
MDVEDNIEEKQAYLTEEIIGKEYDQNRFVNFCLSKRENGDDLTIWSMSELKQLVKEFQEVESGHKHEEANPTTSGAINGDDLQPGEEIVHHEEPKLPEVNLQDGPQEKLDQPPEEHKEEAKSNEEPEVDIPCKVLEKTVLNDSNVKVTIQNPTKVEQGFMSSPYIKYEVLTNIMDNWLVTRRYSDFLWLRQVLIKFNPGQVIPPLPNKKIGNKRFEKDFVNRRMGYLQKFIDSVMSNEIFKASPPLVPFLSFAERGLFESKMKELNSYIPSPYVEEFKTFSGVVRVAREQQDNEKYFGKIHQYFQNQDILFDRLRENLKRYYHGIKACTKILDDIKKDYETFYILNDRVMMKKPITKTFEQISNFFFSWKKIMEDQNEVIKKHFKTFFKFIQMEGTSYQELITGRENLKNTFFTARTKLQAKKEKLWNQDISKWEIFDDQGKVDKGRLKEDKEYGMSWMCTKETMRVNSIEKQFGYVNRMIFEELKKIIDINCERYVNNIKDFCDNFAPTLQDASGLHSAMAEFVNSMGEELAKIKQK